MNAQIVLENIGIRFPQRVLFEQVNWTLYEGMRVALAGRNGSGKSTLMRIIAGRAEANEGKRNVVGSRNLRIGYLDQTLLDSAVTEALELKDRSLSPVNFIKHRVLAQASEHEEVYEDEAEWETRKILGGLGYNTSLMDGPLSHLSGGWLLRMFIAAALVERPQVLLLDEPTNHLDISSIQWLEEFLQKDFKGSLILITHDVALQKRTTNSLAILHGARFYFHTHQHDYISFKESLVDEQRNLEKNIEGVEKKIQENMEFVMKFRAKAQTAARAQSKLKAAETLGEELEQLKDRLRRVQGLSYKLHFRFRLSEPGGKFPLSTKDLAFRYSPDGPWILKNVALDIKRGQRVAIIGDNGAGKTTLLNVMAGRLRPTTGEVLRGHALQEGYFGQHQLDELDLEGSVLENLRARSQGIPLEQVRGWLGAFGFGSDQEVGKKAKVLSGGERARLALLRILASPINLCLLDEPTNHLDVETKELLRQAIVAFEGTTLIVSHDRDFLSQIADRIIYLTADHELTDHLGSLDSFFEKYPQFVRHWTGKTKLATSTPEVAPKPKPAEVMPQIPYEERKRIKNLIRSLEKKVANAEAEIDRLGHLKEALQKEIDDPQFTAKPEADRNSVLERMAQSDAALHTMMVDWERYGTELEVLRTKYPGIQ